MRLGFRERPRRWGWSQLLPLAVVGVPWDLDVRATSAGD